MINNEYKKPQPSTGLPLGRDLEQLSRLGTKFGENQSTYQRPETMFTALSTSCNEDYNFPALTKSASSTLPIPGEKYLMRKISYTNSIYFLNWLIALSRPKSLSQPITLPQPIVLLPLVLTFLPLISHAGESVYLPRPMHSILRLLFYAERTPLLLPSNEAPPTYTGIPIPICNTKITLPS